MTASTAPRTASATRTDIQALRGFAVSIVVLYHARIGAFASGFLGVDVFFVISGFLITRLVADAIGRGTFSFGAFYFRRAKRLLPAAYVTFVATLALAPFFLASSEMHDLRAQTLGAVTFTANAVLWLQAGYFGGEAALKPLLHVWSLSIEEQYYFVLPLSLVLIPRRFWMRGVLLVIAGSVALCLLRAGRDSSFYLLHTRAWELGLGSVGTLLLSTDRIRTMLRWAFWPALAALLALPLVSVGNFHPGPDAFLICTATLILILRAHPLLSAGPVMAVMSRIGDLSYSLYLVHWPLFAFFSNVVLAEKTPTAYLPARLALVVVSLFLAWMLNRYVEEPIRRAEVRATSRVVVGTLATSFTVMLLAVGIDRLTTGTTDYAHIRRPTYGLDRSCESQTDFVPKAICRNSEAPELLLWGDSYAMHLIPGLLASTGGAPGLEQATRSICGPARGLAMTGVRTVDREWAERCIGFNESVLAYLATAPSIRTVVLASPFDQIVAPDRNVLLRDGSAAGDRTKPAGIDEAVAALKRTVDAVRALGKRVVVVAPPPSSDFDIGRCTERWLRHMPMLGVPGDCTIPVADYHRHHAAVLAFLAALPSRADVDVISFDAFLCDAARCRIYIDSTFVYRDAGHFSADGSVLVAKATGLLEHIRRQAR